MNDDTVEVAATILIAAIVAVWAGAATEIIEWFSAVVFLR